MQIARAVELKGDANSSDIEELAATEAELIASVQVRVHSWHGSLLTLHHKHELLRQDEERCCGGPTVGWLHAGVLELGPRACRGRR